MGYFDKRYHPPGTAPGTFTANEGLAQSPMSLHLLDYSPEHIHVQANASAADCQPFIAQESVTWLHISGHPSADQIAELGQLFNLHALALEDVLNSGQRPKIEPFADQLFIVMNIPIMQAGKVSIEQISFFLGKNFLLSFCRLDISLFDMILKRLQDGASRIRCRQPDFLLYSLLDVVIDSGFPVLENFGIQLEDVEESILDKAGPDTLETIHILKRELILLRRMLWPQRDVINQLLRDDHPLIGDDSHVYFRDCYDHIIQIMDLLETYRDMTSSMLDVYLSSVSNRMNEIMRVLTVISTIFIPLTFIVGVYGMNFDRSAGGWNMPELGWSFGYPLVWGVMLLIAAGLLYLFRRRGWL